tara:strand:+ start:78 stop:1103 length:1026 start_codon:yes stop_codon:yes gene_type:complete
MALGWNTSSQITTARTDGGTFTLVSGNLMDLFDHKPQRFVSISSANKEFYIQYDSEIANETLGEANFFAIFGHNLRTADVIFKVQTSDQSDFSGTVATVSASTYSGHTKVINAQLYGLEDTVHVQAPDNGWTLFTYTDSGDGTQDNRYTRITFRHNGGAGNAFTENLNIGSIMFGKMISFPAVQVDSEIAFDYDGTNVQESIGGSQYSNTTAFGPPAWSHTPWLFNYTADTNIGSTSSNPYQFYNPVGRRSLNLNFNYVADSTLFPENIFSDDESKNYDSSDLVTQFYTRMLGKHNPVLFSINTSSPDESDFGIYRLQNNLVAKQIASRTFNFNLKLREAW